MRTQIEKAYQAALLADAAYVTFDQPGYLDGARLGRSGGPKPA